MKAFADALSNFSNSEFVIYGVPYDRSASFRTGQRFAPDEIRRASYNFESLVFRENIDLRDIPIHDMGDIGEFGNPESMIESVGFIVEDIISKKKFPIGLGGEHTITLGAVHGIKRAGIEPFIISIDAHADFRDEYLGDPYSHACVMRRISEIIGLENMAIIGVRSVSPEEMNYFKEIMNENKRLYLYNSFELKTLGLMKVVKEIEEKAGDKPIYLTLDMDGIDPAYAPGVGTPEPFGLHPLDILTIIDYFAKRLVGFDVVEIVPAYDNGNTSILGAYFVRYVIAKVWRAKNDIFK